MTLTRMTIPALTLLLGAALLAGCGDDQGEETDVVQRPAVEINDASMDRLIGALSEFRDLSRALPRAAELGNQQDGAIGVGFGITGLLGDAATPILERHGFASARDFESLMAYTQLALQKVELGEHGGFGGMDRRFAIRGAIEDAKERLRRMEQDEGLSPDQKKLLSARTQRELDSLHDQLAEIEELAGTFKSQFDNLPADNIEVVRRHRVELLTLMTGRPPSNG